MIKKYNQLILKKTKSKYMYLYNSVVFFCCKLIIEYVPSLMCVWVVSEKISNAHIKDHRWIRVKGSLRGTTSNRLYCEYLYGLFGIGDILRCVFKSH